MMGVIGYCGDNCEKCPRYIATINDNEEELKEIAILWNRIGWRDRIISNEEIKCYGCKTVTWCRYEIIRNCCNKKKIDNCGECEKYPCKEIDEVVKQSNHYSSECKERFEEKDYRILNEAFFEKKTCLDNINKRKIEE